ncbi:hypothetical protein E2C01_009158 [Portunus trituberculatus]|uniref:Uncharacterized protein n=1 Tax=Portunus trituberculatus TaxID=210409 RepID=A0A5B7D5B9_PORTR|nr:hypothetical protein [Portunus trituberculatus]
MNPLNPLPHVSNGSNGSTTDPWLYVGWAPGQLRAWGGSGGGEMATVGDDVSHYHNAPDREINDGACEDPSIIDHLAMLCGRSQGHVTPPATEESLHAGDKRQRCRGGTTSRARQGQINPITEPPMFLMSVVTMEVNNYDVEREGPPRRWGGAADDTISGAFEVAARHVRGEEQGMCRHPSRQDLARASGAVLGLTLRTLCGTRTTAKGMNFKPWLINEGRGRRSGRRLAFTSTTALVVPRAGQGRQTGDLRDAKIYM